MTRDRMIRNLAKVLVRYSVCAEKGQTIGLGGSVLAQPLLAAVYEEILRAGAFPAVRMSFDSQSELFYKNARQNHFTTLNPFTKAFARCVDSTIEIYSEANTRAMNSVSASKQLKLARTGKQVHEMLRKKPWVLTLFPTQAYAQEAGMSLSDFEDFVYAATFADRENPVAEWKRISRRQDKLIGKLAGVSVIRIVGKDTDLTMSVKGRSFVNSDGRRNMPSGEIYTGPVEDSVEGYIKFDYPACRGGREVEGARLVFRRGKVVEATADRNQRFLNETLDCDPGARRLGELGIGCNYGIKKFVKRILFDEKIGGTVHLALGRSLENTGGRNKSAIHWDMIKDLRKGGAIIADGRPVQQDGVFARGL